MDQDLSTLWFDLIHAVFCTMSTTNSSGPHSERPKVTLTCVQCRQRKRKCDKKSPCSACIQAGSECTAVKRARLPRGRHATQNDSDLRQRVSRLERLLGAQNVDEDTQGISPPPSPPPTNGDSTMSSLVNEVIGIRELLDKATEDSGEDDDAPSYDSPDVTSTFDVMLFGDGSCHVAHETLEAPSSAMSTALLDIYAQRVNPIIKAVHMDSLRSRLSSTSTNLSQDALIFSLYFAAVSTLNDEECYHCFSESRDALIARFQLAAEVKLSRAGLMTVPSLAVLQAFVVYLVCFRLRFENHLSNAYKIGHRARYGCEAGGINTATAIRIMRILDLSSDSKTTSIFESDLRRRIALSIGVLEFQSAFDSGQYSMLTDNVFISAAPLHINDVDISINTMAIPPQRKSFCDMTFCSITYEMVYYLRQLIYVPLDVYGKKPLVVQDWSDRRTVAENFATTIRQKYLQYCNPDDNFQRYVMAAGEGMVVCLRLLVYRPMYRFYSRAPPPEDDIDILALVVGQLDETYQKESNIDFSPWVWFSWTKWYALAVLLTELCEHTDGPLIEKAWIVAEGSFDYYRDIMHKRPLWKSVEKLMHKARSIRQRALAQALESGLMGAYESPETVHMQQTIWSYNDHSAAYIPPDDGMQDLQAMSLWDNWETFVNDVNVHDQNMGSSDWLLDQVATP